MPEGSAAYDDRSLRLKLALKPNRELEASLAGCFKGQLTRTLLSARAHKESIIEDDIRGSRYTSTVEHDKVHVGAIIAMYYREPVRMQITRVSLLLALGHTALGVPFSLSLSLGSNMVLQRSPASAMLFGFADAGVTVNTTFGSATYTSVAGPDGSWRQQLPPTPASSIPYSIGFMASTGDGAMLTNVLFGDVFLCGGQSNMAFSMDSVFNATVEVARAASYPLVRVMTVGAGVTSSIPLTQFGAPLLQNWSVASPTSIGGTGNWTFFSAACWLTGRNIADALGGDVPIGLISSNWGGTRIEAWTTADSNAQCNATVSSDIFAADDPARFAQTSSEPGPNNATVLWNSMIAPLAFGPTAMRGIWWWQGEQNWNKPAVYACIFPRLIDQWRNGFADPTLYFGFVVLEPSYSPHMRDAQIHAVALPRVAYGSAEDIGDVTSPWGAIHPRAKQIPSARLAAATLAVAYEQPVFWMQPAPLRAVGNSYDNGTVRVTVRCVCFCAAVVYCNAVPPSTRLRAAFGQRR